MIGEGLKEYHRKRDALVGLNVDPPKEKLPLKLLVFRILLALLFFGLIGLVFLAGLMGWRVK